jgi:uncharacterized membrane protein|tara:strand:+ start:152 stop:415 length:264 start_codon:yes stop_codon:yes gene_type:complete
MIKLLCAPVIGLAFMLIIVIAKGINPPLVPIANGDLAGVCGVLLTIFAVVAIICEIRIRRVKRMKEEKGEDVLVNPKPAPTPTPVTS